MLRRIVTDSESILICSEKEFLISYGLIKMALQIAGVALNESSFVLSGDDGTEGMQIGCIYSL